MLCYKIYYTQADRDWLRDGSSGSGIRRGGTSVQRILYYIRAAVYIIFIRTERYLCAYDNIGYTWVYEQRYIGGWSEYKR